MAAWLSRNSPKSVLDFVCLEDYPDHIWKTDCDNWFVRRMDGGRDGRWYDCFLLLFNRTVPVEIAYTHTKHRSAKIAVAMFPK